MCLFDDFIGLNRGCHESPPRESDSRPIWFLAADLFSEYRITRLLRMGLIFPERGVLCVTDLLWALHNDSEYVSTKSLRICRQLLALGIFRKPEFRAKIDFRLAWVRRCLFTGAANPIIPCAICRSGHLLSSTEFCTIVGPLVREFLSGPLTLLQLTRIETCRLIGVPRFERRVDLLKEKLPPLSPICGSSRWDARLSSEFSLTLARSFVWTVFYVCYAECGSDTL